MHIAGRRDAAADAPYRLALRASARNPQPGRRLGAKFRRAAVGRTWIFRRMITIPTRGVRRFAYPPTAFEGPHPPGGLWPPPSTDIVELVTEHLRARTDGRVGRSACSLIWGAADGRQNCPRPRKRLDSPIRCYFSQRSLGAHAERCGRRVDCDQNEVFRTVNRKGRRRARYLLLPRRTKLAKNFPGEPAPSQLASLNPINARGPPALRSSKYYVGFRKQCRVL